MPLLLVCVLLSVHGQLSAPPCVPTLASPSFSSFGYGTLGSMQPMLTHLVIRAKSFTSAVFGLFSVEWATGRTVPFPFAESTKFISASPNKKTLFAVFNSDSRLESMNATGGKRVLLSPPGVTVETGSLSPLATSDSSWVVFCDTSNTSMAGIYVAQARTGGTAVRVSLPLQAGENWGHFALSPDGQRVFYVTGNSSQTRLFVARVPSPIAGSVVEIPGVNLTLLSGSLAFSPDSFLVAAKNTSTVWTANIDGSGVTLVSTFNSVGFFVFTSDSSRLLVRGQANLSVSSEEIYSLIPGETGALLVSNNIGVMGSIVAFEGSTFLANYVGPGQNATNIFSNDAKSISLDSIVQISPNRASFDSNNIPNLNVIPYLDGRAVFAGPYLSNNSEVFINNVTSPGSDAVKISPPGTNTIQLTVLDTGSIMIQTGVRAQPVLFTLSGYSAVLSRSNDDVLLLFTQPNSVSAAYFTSGDQIVVTCIVPPTDGSVLVNGTGVPGHLRPGGGNVVVTQPFQIGGTAVIGGSTLTVGSCKDMVVFNSTWVEGSFDSVSVTGCEPGCRGIATVSQTTSSLSVTVALDCSNASLSDGALAGIIVGCVIGGILIAVLIAIAVVVRNKNHASEFHANQMTELKNENDG